MSIEIRFKGTKKQKRIAYILFTFMKNYIIIMIILALILGIIALINPELFIQMGVVR